MNLAIALITFVLAAGTLAQPGAVEWEALGARWTPDPTWKPSWSKSSSRLVSDELGNLFLSQGDRIYIGSPSGADWKAAPISFPSFSGHTPITLGSGGTILWGSWMSRNRGETWTTLSRTAYFPDYSAAVIAPEGYCLFGHGYDALHRSETLGTAPVEVHFGRTYGRIVDIAISPSGWIFASPQIDDLLTSRDGGKTWMDWDLLRKRVPFVSNKKEAPMAGYISLESRAYGESVWIVGGNVYDTNSIREIRVSGDSLEVVTHANLNLPDSLISGMRIQPGGQEGSILWIGTWGQGVYRSADHGRSWQTANAGLPDLHVEAMVLGKESRLFALTPTGLFAIKSESASVRASGRGGENQDNRRFGSTRRSMPHFGTSAGPKVRADGRNFP